MFESNIPRLPEVLKDNGFVTSAFTAMVNIAGNIGFNKGFDHFFELFHQLDKLNNRPKRGVHAELIKVLGEGEFIFASAEDINQYFFSISKK